MPIFRVEPKMKHGGAQWGNRWLVNVADEDAAVVAGGAIVELQRQVTWSGVQFAGFRVSSLAVDGRTGRTWPFTGVGGQSMSNVLPIFNCAVLDLFPGVKQSGKKFLHYTVDGSEQADGIISNSRKATLQAILDDLIALEVICDEAGGVYTSITLQPNVGMHQMYRAWAARQGVDEGD